MGLWSAAKRAGSWAVKHPFRAGAAVATGGGSEVARSAMGRDNAIKDVTGHDPLGGLKDGIEDGLGFGVDKAGARPDPNDPRYLGQAGDNAQDLYAQALGLRGQAAGIRGRDVAAPSMVTAGTVAGARIAPTAPVGRATVDPMSGRLLLDAATGAAPSQAALQLAAGQDRIAKQKLGMVGAARGVDRASARREAVLSLGDDEAALSQAQAAARAGEMAQARGAFAQQALGVAGLEQGANDLDAQLAASRAGHQADLEQGAQTTNVGNALTADTGNTTRATAVETGNADRNLTGQQASVAGQQGALGVAGQAVGQMTAIGGKKLDAATDAYAVDKGVELKQKDARQQFEIGLLQGATKLSDERAKDDIEPVDEKAEDRLARLVARGTRTWKYKGDDAEHAGPMARTLLRDPLGKRFVHEGEDGLLRIDEPSIHALMLAAAVRRGR